MTESDFNKRLKTLSLIALKVIIKGTGLKTKSELLLWKFYIEGKSCYEIADDLGIESSSVGKALWNAKKELQTIISNEKELIPDEVKPYIELLLQKQ
jgi:DNA-directed RNA polymerase specialized sigma24 family protein